MFRRIIAVKTRAAKLKQPSSNLRFGLESPTCGRGKGNNWGEQHVQSFISNQTGFAVN